MRFYTIRQKIERIRRSSIRARRPPAKLPNSPAVATLLKQKLAELTSANLQVGG